MEGDSSKVSFDLIVEGLRSDVASRNHFDILLSTAIGPQIGSIISCSSPNILAKAIVLANNNEPMTDHSGDKVFNVYFDLKALTGNYLGVFSNTFGAANDEFAIDIANLTAESNATISLIDQITETNNKSELSYKYIVTGRMDEIVCGSMLINRRAIVMYELSNTVTSPSYSILIGYKCSINNNSGVCIGKQNTNTGSRSTTLGELCTAAAYAQAFGYNSNASNPGMMAIGHNNASPSTGGSNTNTSGTAFAIGKGTSTSSRSNAFSVSFTGVVKSASTMTASTTADYAEYFEWQDGNPNGEDRVGKFVTIDGDKVKVATEGDYILGIVSGQPFLLGNGDCDTWNGMYLTDEFNRFILEPAPKMELDEETHEYKEVLDDQGNPVYYGTRPKLNPDYDHTKNYISRFDRKEWAPVGMLGVLSVYQDGTCEVNGYAHCNENGIATACKRTDPGAYRVTEVLSDSIIKVILK